MREYAIDRLKERGEADVDAGRARRLLPRSRAPRRARTCAAPGRPRRCGSSASSCRTCAPRCATWSTPNRLEDAGDFAWRLLVYWWISGFFSEVRLWMLELLDKQQPISQHTRAVARFFALWGEMWRRPSDQVVAGLGECVRLFTESGDEDAAAMALAGRATHAAAVPRPGRRQGRGGADRSGREASDARRRLGGVHGRGGPRLVAVVRGQIADALAHFSRSAEIADEGQDMFTRAVAGNNRTRVLFLMGELDAAEQEWFLTLRLSIRLHYEEGRHSPSRDAAVAASRGEAWRAGALEVVAAARARGPACSTSGLRGAPRSPGGASRKRPRGVRRARARARR